MSETQITREPPYKRWRHPPGCPDADWCSGNGVCYWHCQAHECDQCDLGRVEVFSCEGVCTCGHCPDIGYCPACNGTGLIELHLSVQMRICKVCGSENSTELQRPTCINSDHNHCCPTQDQKCSGVLKE